MKKTRKQVEALAIPAESRFLNADEVAVLLRCSRSHVYTMSYKGILPYSQLPGCRHLIFDRVQIEKLVEACANG